MEIATGKSSTTRGFLISPLFRTDLMKENYHKFYEAVAAHYPEEELVYQSLRGIVRKQFVLSRLKQLRGTLLDLGCNRGAYLHEYSAGKAIGVDIAHAALRIARSRLSQHLFVQGDAQGLTFLKPECVDAVLCSEMLEHVPDAQSVIDACFRVLRPSGQLLLTTPNYRGQKPQWVSVGVMQEYGVNGVEGDRYFHTAYRPEELALMAERAGFSVVEVGTFEKEVKYATRIPVLLFHVVRHMNRLFGQNPNVERYNKMLLDKFSLNVYKICSALKLNGLLVKQVREGVRTFLLAGKAA